MVSTLEKGGLVDTVPYILQCRSQRGSEHKVFVTVYLRISQRDYCKNTPYATVKQATHQTTPQFWGTTLSQSDPSATLFYSLEPFLPSILLHGSNSAYPASRDRALLPTSIQYSYELSSADSFMRSAIAQTTRHLQKLAVFEGQPVSLNNQENVVYGNYADASTPSQHVFGDNLWKMKLIKLRYDPLNVMGLAGGWKV